MLRLCAVVVGMVATSIAHPTNTLPGEAVGDEQASFRGWTRSAAYDGGFFAVWEDGRRSSTYAKVYGARFNEQGTQLDAEGFAVGTGLFEQWAPATACIGDYCLVAWSDAPLGINSRLVRVGDGLMQSATFVGAAPNVLNSPSVATDGLKYLVAWSDLDDVRIRFVDSAGMPQGTAQTLSSGTGNDVRFTAAAFANGTFIVVWTYFTVPGYQVVAQVLDASTGAAIGPRHNLGLAVDDLWPALTTDGTNYFVAWSDPSSNIVARRVSLAGALLDASDVSLAASSALERRPTWAFDGANLVLIYTRDFNEIVGTTVAPALSPSTFPAILKTQYGANALQLSLISTRGLLTWTVDRWPLPTTTESMLLTAGPAAVDAGRLSQHVRPRPERPRATWLGNKYVLAHSLLRDRGGVPVLARLDPSGASTFGSALAGRSLYHEGIDIRAVGPTAVAAWSNGSTVNAREVTSSGIGSEVVLGPAGYTVTAPALAVSGDRLVAAYGEDGPLGRVLRTRHWSSGVWSDPDAGPALTLTEFPERVVLAGNDAGFLVLFAEEPTVLAVHRVTRDGAISPLVGSWSGALNFARYDLAASPNRYLAVAAKQGQDEIVAKWFDNNGVALTADLSVGPTATVSNGAFRAPDPAVTFDGTGFIVVWPQASSDGGEHRIVARRVELDGGLGAIATVAVEAEFPEAVFVTVGSPGRELYAWQVWSPSHDNVVLRTRVFAAVPEAAWCAQDNECIAGACVANLCCSQPLCPLPDGGFISLDGGSQADGGTSSDGGAEADGGAGGAGGGSGGAGGGNGSGGGGGTGSGPLALQVGCGCSTGGPGGVWLVLLALALRRRQCA